MAESLFPATAIITAAFLTRRLGPEGYGFLVLAATSVAWIEWSINSFFARPTIKFISEAEDWKPVADGLVRLQLLTSVAAMVLLWMLSRPLAVLFGEPQLGQYLALFALDVPLFNLAHAHRNVLIGKGDFAPSANLSAVRWLTRLLLILALVGGGLSVHGAILGTIGSSLAELLVARRYVRPSLFGVPNVMPPWALSLPLFASSLCLSFYTRLDLFALKRLGATTEQAGLYGAAQNLSSVPNIFSLAFMPLLLSTLTRLLSRGEAAAAKEIGTHALRGVLALMPIAAVVAGSAGEIISVVFGRDFQPAGTALATLVVGAFPLMMIPVASAILIAEGKASRIPWLTAPLVPMALVGHLIVIPRYGLLGAAGVTTTVGLIGASWAVWSLHHESRIVPPLGTLVRTAGVSAIAFAAAAIWPTPGALVILKLPVIALACLLIFLVLGEFTPADLAMARALITRDQGTPGV